MKQIILVCLVSILLSTVHSSEELTLYCTNHAPDKITAREIFLNHFDTATEQKFTLQNRTDEAEKRRLIDAAREYCKNNHSVEHGILTNIPRKFAHLPQYYEWDMYSTIQF